MRALVTPPRVGSRKTWTSSADTQNRFDESVQWRRVAGDLGLKFQTFAHGHDSDAVNRDRAAHDDLVADFARAGSIFTPCGIIPMPEVLIKILSALPRSTTFVSPVTKFDTGLRSRFAHRLNDPSEVLHCHPLFQDKTHRKIKRTRAAHGEVVDGSVNRQLSDVATGKKDRGYDIRIGAEGNLFAVQRENRAVVQRLEQRVAKLREHDLFDELMA